MLEKIRSISAIKKCAQTLSIFIYSSMALAEMDPATRASTKMENILFGTMGTSLAAIIIGATFIMAKTGKVTWDRFIFIGFCTAGFLGAPGIVSMISNWVR